MLDMERRTRLVHFEPSKDAHAEPATGVTFSPLNKLLLVSVGQDCNALFYDIRKGARVKCLSVGRKLTAVALATDGVTMVRRDYPALHWDALP